MWRTSAQNAGVRFVMFGRLFSRNRAGKNPLVLRASEGVSLPGDGSERSLPPYSIDMMEAFSMKRYLYAGIASAAISFCSAAATTAYAQEVAPPSVTSPPIVADEQKDAAPPAALNESLPQSSTVQAPSAPPEFETADAKRRFQSRRLT